MRICICDDEQNELINTYNIIESYFKNQNIEFCIDKFDDANVLLNKLTFFPEEAQYDIYFLDIIMQIEGTKVARKIKELDESSVIVFITTSKDYAIEAFDVRAVDYILKPINVESFNSKMDAILKTMETHLKKTFVFKATNHSVVSVSIENVVYIESYNRRMIIHMDSMEEISSPILRTRFQDSIPFDFKSHHFIQCHSSYIVNFNQIRSIEKSYFVMKNGDAVPISKQYYQDVKKKYISYLLGEHDE